MTISDAAHIKPPGAVPARIGFLDGDGQLANASQLFFQILHDYVQGTSRIIPCEATGTNIIELTLLPIAPSLEKYNIFETFGFIAEGTSSGNVSANVTTKTGTLDTLKVFKNNGGTQATAGDVVISRQYFLTYVDSLDSGAGGFVIR